jgi:hypothetical protein
MLTHSTLPFLEPSSKSKVVFLKVKSNTNNYTIVIIVITLGINARLFAD